MIWDFLAVVVPIFCFALGWSMGSWTGRRQGERRAVETVRRAYYGQQRFRGPQ